MDLDHIAYTNSANEVDDLDNIAPTISHLRYETEVSCSIQSALALNLETQHEKTSDEDSWKNSDVVCQVIEEVICSSEDVFPAQFSSANVSRYFSNFFQKMGNAKHAFFFGQVFTFVNASQRKRRLLYLLACSFD